MFRDELLKFNPLIELYVVHLIKLFHWLEKHWLFLDINSCQWFSFFAKFSEYLPLFLLFFIKLQIGIEGMNKLHFFQKDNILFFEFRFALEKLQNPSKPFYWILHSFQYFLSQFIQQLNLVILELISIKISFLEIIIKDSLVYRLVLLIPFILK